MITCGRVPFTVCSASMNTCGFFTARNNACTCMYQLYVRYILIPVLLLIKFTVVKEPPYQVSESGYGSFMLPVEVFFRNKDEPKKVRFEYDLLLPNLNDPPINQIRSECLTFQNPSEEFRQKLLKAGGVSSGGPPVAANKGAMQQTKRPAASAESEPPKKKKKMDSNKTKSKKKKAGLSSSESSETDSSSDSESGDEAPMTMKKGGGGGGGGGKKNTPNSWDTGALKRLHKQLNDLQDPQQLQEIVNIIEQTGLFNLTSTTFDFDLCKLDDTTLNKLVKFVEPEKV